MPRLTYEKTEFYEYDYTPYIEKMRQLGVDVTDGEEILFWLIYNGFSVYKEEYLVDEQAERPAKIEEIEEEEGEKCL